MTDQSGATVTYVGILPEELAQLGAALEAERQKNALCHETLASQAIALAAAQAETEKWREAWRQASDAARKEITELETLNQIQHHLIADGHEKVQRLTLENQSLTDERDAWRATALSNSARVWSEALDAARADES
jgi:hypothetical protein